MPIQPNTYHVMFSPSAAGTLKQALLSAHRPGEVLCPFDDFSFGPIATTAPQHRTEWVERELGYSGWADVADSARLFLAAFDEPRLCVTAWLCRREARTYAGFLWWLSHVGDLPVSIVDVDRLSILDRENMGELLDRAIPMRPEDRARYNAKWRQLQAEDAPLRVIHECDLISAPIDYFDDHLISHMTHEWQNMAAIIGSVLVDFSDAGIYQTDDLFLSARLSDLAETGRLEWRGDLSQTNHCELRLLTG